MSAAVVTGLFIYPVKSCRGISLTELAIDDKGPKFDRQWMIVDSENKFITLRTNPKMAEITTAISNHFLQLYLNDNKILIDYTKDCEVVEDVTVWSDTFKAGLEDKSINDALSDFLQKTVKLVRYQSESFRDLKTKGTDFVKQTRFADSRPILLTNENSLVDLNNKLLEKNLQPSVMERFRANIVISGLKPYEEDLIKKIKIGSVEFENPKLCGRCVVITQDEKTGKVVSSDTLKTLASYRLEVNEVKVPFGINLTPSNEGLVSIGDAIDFF